MRSLLFMSLILSQAGIVSAQAPTPEKKPPIESTPKVRAAPEPPLSVAGGVPRRIDIRWKAIPDAVRYELWRKLEPNGVWQRLEELTPRELTFVDTTVVPRSRASYKLVVITNAKAELAPVGPVECLDDFYLHLKSAKGARASVFVYTHLAGKWLKSADAFSVKVGEGIGEVDVLGDFTTGAKLIHVGELATDASVGVIKYLTRDRRLITVTTQEEPPAAVTGKQPPKKKTEAKVEPKSGPKSAPKGPQVTTGTVRVLKFPEPRKVGTVPGTRIVWDIINKSPQRMHFVIMSFKSSRNFFVGTDQTYRVRLPQGGSYTVTVNAENNKVLPMKGKFGLLEGTKYETKFGITKVDRQERLRELRDGK